MSEAQSTDIMGEVEQAQAQLAAVQAGAKAVIIGQDKVIEQVLVTLLAGGHGLLVGLPGLAKTKLVETLGVVLGLQTSRVQFTPDLMPADILGSEVLEEGANGAKSFRFLPGPVFSQLLMADEINRASPRTQSALLQAMQEQHLSVAGARYDLPQPFHVLATQNPLEQEGTYPLPEAQLDRFLCQIDVGYPDRAAERRIIVETTGMETAQAQPVLAVGGLIGLQRLVRQIPVGDGIVDLILDVVRQARPDADVKLAGLLSWAPGPRAAQALLLATRARALLLGRLTPSREDVAALSEPVLKHRMALTFAARASGETVEAVIAQLLKKAMG